MTPAAKKTSLILLAVVLVVIGTCSGIYFGLLKGASESDSEVASTKAKAYASHPDAAASASEHSRTGHDFAAARPVQHAPFGDVAAQARASEHSSAGSDAIHMSAAAPPAAHLASASKEHDAPVPAASPASHETEQSVPLKLHTSDSTVSTDLTLQATKGLPTDSTASHEAEQQSVPLKPHVDKTPISTPLASTPDPAAAAAVDDSKTTSQQTSGAASAESASGIAQGPTTDRKDSKTEVHDLPAHGSEVHSSASAAPVSPSASSPAENLIETKVIGEHTDTINGIFWNTYIQSQLLHATNVPKSLDKEAYIVRFVRYTGNEKHMTFPKLSSTDTEELAANEDIDKFSFTIIKNGEEAYKIAIGGSSVKGNYQIAGNLFGNIVDIIKKEGKNVDELKYRVFNSIKTLDFGALGQKEGDITTVIIFKTE